jgi:threonine dehydratase
VNSERVGVGEPASSGDRRAINRAQIAAVYDTIRPRIRRTPVIEVDAAAFGLTSRARLIFKLEQLQHAGSFKARGAFANLLLREVPPAGVVAASGGNHGAAVAFAARALHLPARIFVPSVASPAKMQQIRAYGAELVVTGERYADALAASQAWVASSKALPIHAYDQPETLLGQGTLGLELEDQAPELDTLLIAVGGGGLIGGVATWYAGRPDRRVRLIGVEPELAPTLTRALQAGQPVDAEAGGIAADSLAPQRVGQLMFPLAQRHVERVVLVSDDAIRGAQEALWRELRVVAEPGGAAAFAAVLSGGYQPSVDERIGVVVCGGNTTAVRFDGVNGERGTGNREQGTVSSER